jgi:hypothetical protein
VKSNGFNDLENLDAGNSKGDHIKLDQYKQAKLDLYSGGYRFYLLNQVFRASLFSMNRIFECQVPGFLVEDNLPPRTLVQLGLTLPNSLQRTQDKCRSSSWSVARLPVDN